MRAGPLARLMVARFMADHTYGSDSDIRRYLAQCPLCPRKQTLLSAIRMSA
jgi:hypothetical protein